MTSAQTMLFSSRRLVRLALMAAVAALVPLTGCTGKPDLVAPQTLVAPYDQSKGEALWAVVPLRNESGTSMIDVGLVSDQVVAAVEQAQGLRCLPLNRTIEAMRALNLSMSMSPADVKKLASAMGVDGLVIGSITAWDHYTPTAGLALALYVRPGSLERAGSQLNPRVLATRPTEMTLPGSNFPEGPASIFTCHLDAKNNQVLMDIRQYAEGRQSGPSAAGWRRFTKSMDLYSEFAASYAVRGLLDSEWIRLTRDREAQIDSR